MPAADIPRCSQNFIKVDSFQVSSQLLKEEEKVMGEGNKDPGYQMLITVDYQDRPRYKS